ncbi:MAG: ShlB/FhaC/HecB family hemolysin secretion/activation protein [Gallionella sp.]
MNMRDIFCIKQHLAGPMLFAGVLGIFLSMPQLASAAEAAAAAPATEAEQAVLRFAIDRYVVEGATLLSKAEIDAAVAPYVGKSKDFSDVQRALEAVEEAYAKRGFSAVRVVLPEQELEKGTVRFRVVESRYGQVTVKDNRFFTKANVLNALPSVRSGGVPHTKQVSRELKLANENPARQLNVVLKAGEKDDVVDANVIVTDSKPSSWGVSLDNTGTPETGRARLGLSYRHANLFNADHVASIQYVTSPQYPDRLRVLGGSYKIPLYRSGNSLEFFGGYSNVNSVMGGLSNFQGGGLLFSTRYNFMLDRVGVLDPRLSLGVDWRDFRRIELTNPPPTVLYNEIVVLPVSVTYAAQGKFFKSDVGFNASLAANVPKMNKGHKSDFAKYDQVNMTIPQSRYRVLRYGANYSRLIADSWQFRTVLIGQYSNNVLIQGEQFRLGGADAVRGFSEGSEGGESGARLNLEGYTPDFGMRDIATRALVFYDAGQATSAAGLKTTISGAGIGLRANYAEQFSLRVDLARIIKAGTDPEQRAGDWRAHMSFFASF